MSWTRYLSNPLKKSHWTFHQANQVFEQAMWPKVRDDLPRGSKKAAWIEYLELLQQKGYITPAEKQDWVHRKIATSEGAVRRPARK